MKIKNYIPIAGILFTGMIACNTTASDSNEDIAKSYDLGANSYVTKGEGLEQFSKIMKSLECFWLHVAKLPKESL